MVSSLNCVVRLMFLELLPNIKTVIDNVRVECEDHL